MKVRIGWIRQRSLSRILTKDLTVESNEELKWISRAVDEFIEVTPNIIRHGVSLVLVVFLCVQPFGKHISGRLLKVFPFSIVRRLVMGVTFLCIHDASYPYRFKGDKVV